MNEGLKLVVGIVQDLKFIAGFIFACMMILFKVEKTKRMFRKFSVGKRRNRHKKG